MFLTKKEAFEAIKQTLEKFKPNTLEHRIVGNIFNYCRLIDLKEGQPNIVFIQVVVRDMVGKDTTEDGIVFWEVDLYAIVNEEGAVIELPRTKLSPCFLTEKQESLDLVDIDKIKDFAHYRMLMTASSDVAH